MSVADRSRQILVDPVNGRKTQKVSEWQWKILSGADSSRKILIVEGRPWRSLNGKVNEIALGRYS